MSIALDCTVDSPVPETGIVGRSRKTASRSINGFRREKPGNVVTHYCRHPLKSCDLCYCCRDVYILLAFDFPDFFSALYIKVIISSFGVLYVWV